jgi:hypothetical protein
MPRRHFSIPWGFVRCHATLGRRTVAAHPISDMANPVAISNVEPGFSGTD